MCSRNRKHVTELAELMRALHAKLGTPTAPGQPPPTPTQGLMEVRHAPCRAVPGMQDTACRPVRLLGRTHHMCELHARVGRQGGGKGEAERCSGPPWC